jgi:flagellar basal-body rod protein FlgF
MDRGIFVAMAGAKEVVHALTSNANNLANVNTDGFRADFEQFRAQPVFGPGYPSRVYAMNERPGVDFSTGALVNTGRELDVAVAGDGWIAVQGKDGREAYTRAGNLHVTEQGLLTTGTGLQVIGNNGPIALPPAQKLEIGADGSISLLPLGAPANALAVADRIKLVNPPKEQMDKGLDGLMRQRDGNAPPADANVKLVSGMLETSNVSGVEEMVEMIELQRRYEMQLKLMKTVEDDSAAGAQLMRMG